MRLINQNIIDIEERKDAGVNYRMMGKANLALQNNDPEMLGLKK